MKKILSLLVTFLYVTIASSQSIQKLDNNPSFKGITIGAPISKYSEILLFSHVYLGRNIYHVRASNYLSIFNVSMNEMMVIEEKGKVYAIQLSKTYSQSGNSGIVIFNPNDLLSWESNLRSLYGQPILLDNENETPAVYGRRWKGNFAIIDIVYLYGVESAKLQYYLYQRNDDY